MKKDSVIKLVALGGVPLIMVLGNSMLIPVFPQIKSALNISQLQVGLVITLFSIPAGISIPILGFLSDKIGRKLVIVPSVLLYGLGGVISGMSPLLFQEQAYPLLLTGRIVQGIGAAGTAPIAMALVSDIFTGDERSRAQGAIEAANGLGKVISPILGSVIAIITWIGLFFAYACLAIPIALGVWFLVKEPKTKEQDASVKQYLQKIKQIFSRTGKSLLGSYLAASVVLFTLFGILSYLSDILEVQYGLKGVVKGVALAGPVLAMSTTSYVSGKVLQKKSCLMKPFIVGGLSILSVSLLALSLIGSNLVFFLALIIMGSGTGLVLPAVNTVVTSSAPLAERGGITALYGSVRFFGVAAGPPAYSKLLEISKNTMFWTGSGIALIAFFISFLLISKKEVAQETSPEKENQTETPAAKQKKRKLLAIENIWKPAIGVTSGLLILFPWLRRKQR